MDQHLNTSDPHSIHFVPYLHIDPQLLVQGMTAPLGILYPELTWPFKDILPQLCGHLRPILYPVLVLLILATMHLSLPR